MCNTSFLCAAMTMPERELDGPGLDDQSVWNWKFMPTRRYLIRNTDKKI
jgi:hypothetical protein